ncbi:MAG: hypothetical protein ABSH09_34435 [Bryobacteraceae bacterium]
MGTPLKNICDWGNRSLPVTARLRSSSLPVTARLRSKFFITLGGPQAHGHPVPVTARNEALVNGG